MSKMKVLVLGATGMLGQASALALKDVGYEVVACGRRLSDEGFWSSKGCSYIGGVTLEDAASFNVVPNDVGAVVHMAGAMPAHSGMSPMPYVKSIVDGMVNVCEWMKKVGCKRIVFNTTPSDIAHHFSKDPVSEDASRSFPHNGGDHAIYAIAKNAAVDILTHYKIADGMLPCVFRHLTVYGPWGNPYYYLNGEKKVLPYRRIIDTIVAGGPVEIWGDPKVQKELLYINDFTDAVVKAVNSQACGLFNLPGYRPYTLEEQIDGFINAFATRPIEKIYCPEKPSTPRNLLEIGGAKSLLGWTPRYTWEEACKDWANKVDEL